MNKWLISKIWQLAREIKVKAAYWTAFGAMALPLGVSLIALATVFSELENWLIKAGFVLIILGFIFFIAGWVYTIREERINREKEQRDEIKNKEDRLQRKREHVEMLALIAEVRSGRNMSTPRLINFIKRLEEEIFQDESDGNYGI